MEPTLENNESKTFAGLWIQHEPAYKIVVAFTQDGGAAINKYVGVIPLEIAPYIEIRTVDKSLASLKNDQQILVSSLHEKGIEVDSYVDVKNNQIRLDLTKENKAIFDSLANNREITLPGNLNIKVVTKLSTLMTGIYGGLALQYGSPLANYVSSGFSVHNNNTGTDGILTAGHAVNSTLYWNTSHSLSYQSEANSGAYDVQWHRNATDTFPNKIQYWSDGSTLNITATKSRAQQNIGDIVSKYGLTTQYTAGELVANTTYGGPQYVSYTYMLVENIYNYSKIAEQGDSGGPVFSGNTALGISHAVTDDRQWLSYMAINYIDGISGLSVKTSP